MLMQRLNTWLKIAALAVLYVMVQPTLLHAQYDVLKKPVPAKNIDHQRLEAVLEELSKEGYFTFSYNSSIVDKDRLVTLTLRESTLRHALAEILGPGYDLKSADDYVIIRRSYKKASPDDRRMDGPWRDMPPPPRPKMNGGPWRDSIDLKVNRGPWKGERGPWKGEGGPKMHPPIRKYKDSVQIKRRNERRDTLKFEMRKQTVASIIADMASEKIIRDKDSFLWFGLDNTQFIVDGKPVADSLRAKFQAKYIKPDGMGYYFGPVSIRGTGYFFDKKDIYGSPQ